MSDIDIEIRRPRIEDRDELNRFFSKVIRDTFEKEGISELIGDMKDEIECKKQYLKSDLESSGEHRYFLISLDGNEIVGCIEYGPVSELIVSCTNGALSGLSEIGTVFVHPDYQRRGIGTLLLHVMLLTLQNRGISEFCLDSGYSSAQKVWKKKLGEPDYFFQNYWGEGCDHMIWKRNTADLRLQFHL
ncbi:GNAT family N-acetyltransferase [Metabacillus idriensis]|uniref:GNAT family N-acetyltransferase n=1 Tax=Metabacillus idriensis TaxID=324768 RepID=UPI0028147C8B|nr:GNAT family N-acetyltransferase [Metabacillus idriensis]MDR0136711.1 GNAT family N-acetyltransferase [Metabacillus idriensis]